MNTQRRPLTSVQWWESVKRDEAKLRDWLAKQYHGERTAHDRIAAFRDRYVPQTSRWRRVLDAIAAQELAHAAWVGELLTARGMAPVILNKDERYWERTMPGITSFESGAAVAAQAEQMRLERITVIAADPEAPADIRAVFARILPQEQFHARAFTKMAGDAAMAEALENHRRGMEAIGLIPDGGF